MGPVRAGHAFLVSGSPFTPTPHLWLILTDPDPVTTKVLAVMVVTARAHTDKTVLLVAQEHEFLKHDSHVDYSSAILVAVSRIQDCIDNGSCHEQPDMSPALLKKVRKGLLTSPRTIHYFADHCRACFDADGCDLPSQ